MQEERKYYSSCASTPRRSPTSSIFFLIQNKYCFHEITTSAFVYSRRCTNDAPAVGAALQIGRGGDTTHRKKKHARRAGRQQVWESFLQIFIPEYRNKNKICSKGLLKRVKIFLELLLHRKIEEDAGEGVALVDIDHHLRVKHRPGELLYRIQKELKDFISNPPNGCSVAVSKNMKVWIITITGLDGSVYGGGRFRLRVAFPSNYPSRPPSVYFLQTPPPPKHEHVYTNGDICLSLLGKDWKPNLTISGLTISIVSMLNSATEKRRPQDNAARKLHRSWLLYPPLCFLYTYIYILLISDAKSKPGGPQTNWVYHDQRS